MICYVNILNKYIQMTITFIHIIFIYLGYSQLPQHSSPSESVKQSIVDPFTPMNSGVKDWNTWSDKLGVPYFVGNQTHTVLAPLGHTTYLHCIVGNLGDRQVSTTAQEITKWIIHIIRYNVFTHYKR